MNLPEIPTAATETYLDKLTEKILKQLQKTHNQKVRDRLNALLQEVEKRKQQLTEKRLQSDTTFFDTESPPSKGPTEFFDTTHLSKDEQNIVKQRLRELLEDIATQRPEPQHNSLTFSISDSFSPKGQVPSSAPLHTVKITAQEYEQVKEQMKAMMAEVKRDRHEKQTLQPSEILAEATQQPDQASEPAEDLTSFASVCRRVGKGESMKLFTKIELSDRERQLVDAFIEHLSQTKALKRQQAFDMQHLTSRSIRELEQIFKTYHLQGYLKAELNNIYNRLLNLRSRFSSMLS